MQWWAHGDETPAATLPLTAGATDQRWSEHRVWVSASAGPPPHSAKAHLVGDLMPVAQPHSVP